MPMGPSYTLRNKRVWVAGDRGLVGSALVRRLQREGCELLTAPRESDNALAQAVVLPASLFDQLDNTEKGFTGTLRATEGLGA